MNDEQREAARLRRNERDNKRRRERYQNDPEYRERILAREKKKYYATKDDPEKYRKHLDYHSYHHKMRYLNDGEYRDRLLEQQRARLAKKREQAKSMSHAQA